MPRQQLVPLVCLAAAEPGWEKGLGMGDPRDGMLRGLMGLSSPQTWL